MSSTASTATPYDFCKDTTSPVRGEWQVGPMRNLIAALNGQKVTICTDRLSGHTLVDVTLEGVRQAPGYGTFQVCVAYEYEPGKVTRTWYPLFKIGPAIVLTDAKGLRSAKWDALDSEREEKLAAIKWVRENKADEIAELDVKLWKATTSLDSVRVTAHESRSRDGKLGSWTVSLRDLAEPAK